MAWNQSPGKQRRLSIGRRIRLATPWFYLDFNAWLLLAMALVTGLVTSLLLYANSRLSIVSKFRDGFNSVRTWLGYEATLALVLGLIVVFVIADRAFLWEWITRQSKFTRRLYSFFRELFVGPIWLVFVGFSILLSWAFRDVLKPILYLEVGDREEDLKKQPEKRNESLGTAVQHLLGSFLTFAWLGKYVSLHPSGFVLGRLVGERAELEHLVVTRVPGPEKWTLPNAFFQFLSIISLTVALFALFLIREEKKIDDRGREQVKRRKEERAVFCITVYALLVYDDYVPLVLAMALAAIYVAAEHFGSLQTAEEDIEHSANKLVHLEAELRNLVYNESGEEWRQRMYAIFPGSYRSAERRIISVVRFFDIDASYIEAKGLESASMCRRPEFRLIRYLAERETPDKEAPGTLWTSLYGACLRENSDPRWFDHAPLTASLKVRVVAEVPILASGHDHFSNEEGQSFLGLLWQLVIFSLVNALFERAHAWGYEEGDPVGPWDLDRSIGSRVAQIRVGFAPIWVHVVDDHVWQLFQKRESSFETRVRPVTQSGMEDADRRVQADSYASLITADYGRGGSSEAYASSILRLAIKNQCPDAESNVSPFIEILPKVCRFLSQGEATTDLGGKRLDKYAETIWQDIVLTYLSFVWLSRESFNGRRDVTFSDALEYLCTVRPLHSPSTTSVKDVYRLLESAPSRLMVDRKVAVYLLSLGLQTESMPSSEPDDNKSRRASVAGKEST